MVFLTNYIMLLVAGASAGSSIEINAPRELVHLEKGVKPLKGVKLWSGHARAVTECSALCNLEKNCWDFYFEEQSCDLFKSTEEKTKANGTFGQNAYIDCEAIGDEFVGIHSVRPYRSAEAFDVHCAFGWTILYKRTGPQLNMKREFNKYAVGFGVLSGDFWLGNRHMHYLTTQATYALHIDLGKFDNNSVIDKYSQFAISDEDDMFRLTAVQSAGKNLAKLSGLKFTTKDMDNDNWHKNCAVSREGGWWYDKCGSLILTAGYPVDAFTCEVTSGGSLIYCMSASVPKLQGLKSVHMRIKRNT